MLQFLAKQPFRRKLIRPKPIRRGEAASIDQAKAASNDKAKASIDDQAKAVSNGKDKDDIISLVTRDQKREALKMWKELLIQTQIGLPALPTTHRGGEFKGS
jgi:hypothetical protein